MKNVSLMQVAARLINTPLLIHPESLNTLLNILATHIGGKAMAAPGKTAALPAGMSTRSSVQAQGGIAVIPICGILAYKSDDFMEWLFGDTSYETIREQFQTALADPNISGIVFDVDSPGGEVCGCFDLADEIYNARGIKPISSVVNEVAYSAAYLLASSAEKVYIPRTGSAGSIGVIMEHMDQSKYDENIGVKYTPIFAGSHKNDFDRHSQLSPEMLQTAKGIVDSHYELFIKTIARNRGMSPQAVRDTEAALYFGKSAVDIGLADSVTPWSKAMSEITKKKSKGGTNMKALVEKLRAACADAPAELMASAFAEMGFVAKAQGEGVLISVPNIAAIAGALGLTPEQVSSDLKGVDLGAAKAAAEKAVRAQIVSVLEVCALGGQEKMGLGLVKDGTSLEDARTKIIEAKAAGSQQVTIKSTVTSLGTGEVSPLVADARQRAEAAKNK
jgi:signal peptide peptidase SppA